MGSPPSQDDSMEVLLLHEGFSDLKVSEEKLSGEEKDLDLDLELSGGEKGKEGKSVGMKIPRFPQRAGQPDCTFYLRYGSCKFGMKCKFNHPPKKKLNNIKPKINKVSESDQDYAKAKEVSPQNTEQKEHEDNADEKFKDSTDQNELEETKGSSKKKIESNVSALFIGWWDSRNAVPDESTVPVNDPVSDPVIATTKGKDKESTSEMSLQECKFFSTPNGCKFGKSCKYLHTEGKSDISPVELNFLGLPLRPGEKECLYYMRNGSCKYATNCKFHHPDPTAATPPNHENHNHNYNNNNNGNGANNYNYNNTDETPRENHVPVQSWSEQRTVKEPVPYLVAPPSYMPGLIPHHSYQVPVNPYYMAMQNYPPSNNMMPHQHQQQQQQASYEEYPERPGQPECQHFLKNGFCRYRLACKFHHPRPPLLAPAISPGFLSPVGLPMKPDQPVCVYYGRFGVCKYGPACKFDHPLNYGPSAPLMR